MRDARIKNGSSGRGRLLLAPQMMVKSSRDQVDPNEGNGTLAPLLIIQPTALPTALGCTTVPPRRDAVFVHLTKEQKMPVSVSLRRSNNVDNSVKKISFLSLFSPLSTHTMEELDLLPEINMSISQGGGE